MIPSRTGSPAEKACASDSDEGGAAASPRRFGTGFRLWQALVAGGLFSLASSIGSGAQVQQAWAAHQAPSGATGHEVAALATDAAGNLYVAGQSHFPTSRWDIILTQYDPAGAQRWQTRYHGGLDSDFAAAIAVNASNVFLAGSSLNDQGHSDFVTLKYDTGGVLEWVARYDGPANGSEVPVALAVDGAGHAVVAGNSSGDTSHSDIAVVKYDAAGHPLWTFRYDGPNQNDDRVVALRLDAQGNIHLAGTSGELAGKSELVTLKLSPDGQELWTRRHLPGSDAHITARGLALDGTGHVVVVGTEGYNEFLTIKYGADGTLLWAARFRAEEPAAMVASDVRVDAADNIVTGGNLYGSGTNDAVLVKCDPEGRQLWASRIAHPQHAFHLSDFGLDDTGNVYLTGTPHNDALTAKVGADGSQIWSASYHSTGEFYDVGELLTVDGAGNVFVAGRSIYFGESFVSIVKYRQTPAAGAPAVTVSPLIHVVEPGASVAFTAAAEGAAPLHYQWRFTGRPIPGATGPSLSLTNVQLVKRGDYSVVVSNGVAVTISSEARLTVLESPAVTITPSGQIAFLGAQAGFLADVRGSLPFTFQWRHEGTNLPGATNNAFRLTNLAASDAGGYSLVVSNPAGAVTSGVVALTVSRAVEQLQALRYNGPGNRSDEQPLLRLAAGGESVVAARSEGIGTGGDIAVLKYAADGELLWASMFNRVDSLEDQPTDLALDAAGNVLVTGWSGQPYGERVFTTLKYSADGQQLWVRHFRETNDLDSFATSVAVDPIGNVTVAGRAEWRPVVIRYDPAGNEQWVARGEDSTYQNSQAAKVDPADNTFLGAAVLQNDDTDFLLRKFDPSGGVLWTRTFDAGPGDRFIDLALDGSGNVVMLGSSFGHASDAVVLKYTPDGERLWATNFDGLPFQNDFPRALAVDGASRITVVASIEDGDDDELGTAIARFDADGRRLYAVVEPDFEVTDATQMAVDAFGNAYVTGTGTAKYDARGHRLWLAPHAGPGWFEGIGTAVAVDESGDVHVAGHTAALTGLGNDLLLWCYRQEDPAGAFLLDLVRLNDGALRLVTPPGTNFAVEASSDLTEWTRSTEEELQTLLQPGPPSPLPFPQRFYRLVRTGETR